MPATARMFCISLLLAFFQLISFTSHAQFSLEWEKTIGTNSAGFEMQNITCVSKVNNRDFIGYKVMIDGKPYPAVAFVDSADNIFYLNDFSTNKNVTGYEIVNFVQDKNGQIIAGCNHYGVDYKGINPMPAQMIFELKNNKLQFLSYNDVNLTGSENITSCSFTDYYKGPTNRDFIAVSFSGPGNQYTNLYEMNDKGVMKTMTFQKASAIKVYWSNGKNILVSVETPFAPGSIKKYYQCTLLDNNLNIVRQYPDVTTYLDSNATDRLLDMRYNADYSLGFAIRQVTTLTHQNLVSWFGFNGYPQGTRNRMIGENLDVLTAGSIEHNGNEKIAYNYSWPGSGIHSWTVSVDTSDTKDNRLVMSIDSYDGLQRILTRIGDVDSKEGKDLDPFHLGKVNINPKFNDLKCFSRSADSSVYVVANLNSSYWVKQGIHIIKWKFNAMDKRMGENYLNELYGGDVYYNSKIISKNDKQDFIILAIDSSDANYAIKDDLIGKRMEVVETIKPITNKSFWQGEGKVGRRKYMFTKVVLAKAPAK